MTKNLQRRHLTNDQYLAITEKYLAWLKDQSERQQADADPSSRPRARAKPPSKVAP
jgi:hypothetical protein